MGQDYIQLRLYDVATTQLGDDATRLTTRVNSAPNHAREAAWDSLQSGQQRLLKMLVDYRITLRVEMDQQHIIDPGLLVEVVGLAEVYAEDTVLEVGAGIGNITQLIADRAKRVLAVEKDRQFEQILREKFKGKSNVGIMFCNILDIRLPSFDKIVSNLPFSVCEGLLQKLIHSSFKLGVLVTPLPFAQIVNAKPDAPGASKLSVMSSAFFESRIERLVEPDSFYPSPEFTCALLKVRPYDTRDMITMVIRHLFRQRDKKAKNALRIALVNAHKQHGNALPKLEAKRTVEAMNLTPKVEETKIGALSKGSILQIIQELRAALG